MKISQEIDQIYYKRAPCYETIIKLSLDLVKDTHQGSLQYQLTYTHYAQTIVITWLVITKSTSDTYLMYSVVVTSLIYTVIYALAVMNQKPD